MSTSTPEHSNTSTKHVILYGFLALSLVREKEQDVAAIAIYHFKDTVEVYYTKNTMKQADVDHANELAELIRSTAKDCLNTIDFFDQYFELILRNCKGKFMRRFGDFKHEVTRPKPQDEIVPCSAADLLNTFAGLFSSHTPFSVRNKADKDACSFSETGNLYEGLHILLNAVIDNIYALQTYDEYIVFAAHAYIIAQSSVTRALVEATPPLGRLVEACEKFGLYFRGATRLYNAISQSSEARVKYSTFSLNKIDPLPSKQVHVETDWYYILQCIYFRETGRIIPVSKATFTRHYARSLKTYEQYPLQPYLPHCETTLITELTKTRGTTELGVSKACCGCCTAFIDGFNQHRRDHSESAWVVGGCHGKIYNWLPVSSVDGSSRAGMDSVRRWLQRAIVTIINESAYRSTTESPTYISSPDLDEGPASASVYKIRRMCISGLC